MNKPIRTLSIFCLLLFLALLGNVTYLQYIQASELNNASEYPENRRVIEVAFSRERGAILVGRTPIAESVPSDDKYEFQRRYTSPKLYDHLTGWISFFNKAGLERTQNDVISGEEDTPFVSRQRERVKKEGAKGGEGKVNTGTKATVSAQKGLQQNT